MTPKRRTIAWMVVALAAAPWACGDDSVTRPDAPQETPAPVLISRAGIAVPKSQMNGLLAQVTREIAVALADPAVRSMVYQQLHASPYREHKLHFGTFLRGDATTLLSGMAGVRNATLSPARSAGAVAASVAVLATLDSIVDLEFYMPVKEHYAAWDGGERLIVASALDDDGSTPVGFDLTGRQVRLSADKPPATPTLVVVPVETDFSRIPSATAPDQVDAATMDIMGVHMTRSVIYNDHEGWPNGNPEFEVHLFQTDVDLEYIDNICAGERREAPYTYNTQETQDWSGDVVLATEGRMAMSPNNQFHIWEDDSDPCTLTGGRPPKIDNFTFSDFSNAASGLIGITTTSIENVAMVKAILTVVPAAYNFFVDASDDEVGVITLAAGCWPASGPAHFKIMTAGNSSTQAGWATLDFRFASAQRDPLCPFSVALNGPVSPTENTDATWDAITYYGTAPFTFSWYRNGVLVGTGPSYSQNVGNVDFELRLEGTDAGGATDSYGISVDVQPAQPECIPNPPEVECPVQSKGRAPRRTP